MTAPVHYNTKDSIAVIRMDDGKVNALGPTCLLYTSPSPRD